MILEFMVNEETELSVVGENLTDCKLSMFHQLARHDYGQILSAADLFGMLTSFSDRVDGFRCSEPRLINDNVCYFRM